MQIARKPLKIKGEMSFIDLSRQKLSHLGNIYLMVINRKCTRSTNRAPPRAAETGRRASERTFGVRHGCGEVGSPRWSHAKAKARDSVDCQWAMPPGPPKSGSISPEREARTAKRALCGVSSVGRQGGVVAFRCGCTIRGCALKTLLRFFVHDGVEGVVKYSAWKRGVGS